MDKQSEVVSKQGNAVGMLSRYRVLDLTDEKGIYAGQLLGSFGADVIKLEKPAGDKTRNIGPFVHNIPGAERSLFWLAYNTNKRGITLNIETIDGQEIFKRLVKTADVILESSSPGFMEKLGLGYPELEKINPKIIMTSIAPFGQTGPYKDYKASNLDCWAMGGVLSSTGERNRAPAQISHIPAAFLVASQDAAWTTAIALYWRGRSGKGQWVDISVQESVVRTAFLIRETWLVTRKEFQRSIIGYQVAGTQVILRRVWEAKDGYVAYMIFGGQQGAGQVPLLVNWMMEEGMVDDFLKQIDWSSLDWGSKTLEEANHIQDCFRMFFKTKTKAQLFEGAFKRGIMLQPMNTPKEIMEHPQLEARSYWVKMDYPHLGLTITYPGRCCLASEAPPKLWRRAPLIGEHNQEIYQKELGFSNEELIILKQAGVI